MQIRAYVFSAILHSIIIAFLLWDWSFTLSDYEKTSVPVIMVDLKKVQIGELTNLPPKIVKNSPKKTPQKEKKIPSKPQKASQKTTTQPKSDPIKPKQTPTPKESVKAITSPKKEEKEIKKEKKAAKKTQSTPALSQDEKTKNQKEGLKNLLASVEAMKKKNIKNTPQPPQTGQEIQNGIEGGNEGSLMQPLTISEKDLIAHKLKGCWNVDAGISGIENMIVEVQAYVNRDGSIRDVKILNMKSDPAFRSVAESARRAVYICAGLGEESPFKMLADKRSDSYQGWKEIFVRFNPLDGGVY